MYQELESYMCLNIKLKHVQSRQHVDPWHRAIVRKAERNTLNEKIVVQTAKYEGLRGQLSNVLYFYTDLHKQNCRKILNFTRWPRLSQGFPLMESIP
jgi:hypothetical protein